MYRYNRAIINIWFIYIAFYVCFKHLFIDDTILYLIYIMLFIVVVLTFYRRKVEIQGKWFFWCLLIFDMFFTIQYTEQPFDALKFILVFVAFFLNGFVLSCLDGWEDVFKRWIKFGCMIHLAYTYFSVFFTDCALQLSKYLLTAEAQTLTIRWVRENNAYAGISGQTGVNAYLFLILFGLFFSDLLVSTTKKEKQKNIFLLFVVFIGILLTKKKGALLISILSVLGVYLCVNFNCHKRKLLLFLLFVIGLTGTIFIIFFPYINQVFENSINSRLILLQEMTSAISEKPLLGSGVSSVNLYTKNKILGHNIYLQMWVEQGIIGELFLICSLGYPMIAEIIHIYKYYGYMKLEEKRNRLFSLFFQLFMILEGCIESSLYTYNVVLIYFIILALNRKNHKIVVESRVS